MKQGNKPQSGLRKAWGGIHMVDKCLMIFMIVLLGQSAYSLFMHSTVTKGSDGIDIIVRTAAASIFGYFLSANFMGDSSQSRVQSAPPQRTGQASLGYAVTQTGVPQPSGPRAQVGIAVPQAAGQAPSQGNPPQGAPPQLQPLPPPRAQSSLQSGSLQIIAAAGIGLFCLLVLLVVRNAGMWATAVDSSGAATATVGQFRDFVSGCVGFLIGTPTGKSQAK